MGEDTRAYDNPGIAALKATMQTLAQAVSELNQRDARDHDTLTGLSGHVSQLAGEMRQLIGTVQAIQQQLAPNADRIRQEAETKILDSQRLASLHVRMDMHEAVHATAWSKLGSGLFWVVAAVLGLVLSLTGDWIKKRLGLGGP